MLVAGGHGGSCHGIGTRRWLSGHSTGQEPPFLASHLAPIWLLKEASMVQHTVHHTRRKSLKFAVLHCTGRVGFALSLVSVILVFVRGKASCQVTEHQPGSICAAIAGNYASFAAFGGQFPTWLQRLQDVLCHPP